MTIGKNDAGQRLDRFLSKALPLLPPALAQKYIRIKRVKVNGGRAQRDQRLQEGDVLQLYINDEFFDKPSEENMFLTLFKPRLTVVYEDEHILLADKPQGLVVHADETEKVNTLINHIQKKQVSVYHRPVPGGKTAVTDYRVLDTRGELSLVEIGLETGRTHQIRATMADLGCPLLGDGKYGRGDVNRRYGETRQALYAYKLTFDLPTDAGILNYLRGRTFTVEDVPFREKYFGAGKE